MNRIPIPIPIRAFAILSSLAGFFAVPGHAKELQPIPDKLVVLTFDDANKSDRAFVADVLKKHGFGATFYVTEGLGFLKNKDHYTTWQEIRELHDLGFEIGNHTQFHENVTGVTHEQLTASLKHIDQRCIEHGIPQPTTFCYPGFSNNLAAVRTLEGLQFQFARRGVGPEFPDGGEGGRGPAYDPRIDHPLLIPTTGYAGPKWGFDDLKWAVAQARGGNICVLNFHGVPGLEHPWVSTDPDDFEKYMQYLKDEHCTVIAMRDLARFVDPAQRPQDPYAPITHRLATPRDLAAKPVPNPLGLNLNEHSLGWQLPAAGGKQSAFHILVASDRQKLDADVGDLWDSGWRHSAQHADVPYRGTALRAGSEVWWKVRVRTDIGATSAFSAASAIKTADLPEPPKASDNASAEGGEPEPIDGQDGKAIEHRVVFLGNTLMYGMDQHGYLETALTARWPHHDLTFRNLGWPADDVFGTARSEFGSDQKTGGWQPPGTKQGFGYSVMMEQLADARATSVIVGYGSEAAFAASDAELKRFQEGYEALLADLENSGAKLILLGPPRHEAFGTPMPDPAEQNLRLQRVSAWIGEVAKQRGHRFVELFDSLVARTPEERLTDNGVHLNQLGYQRMAETMLRQLGIREDGASVAFGERGIVLQSSGARLSEVEQTARGFRFDLTTDTLPTAAWTAPATIAATGDTVLKIDAETRAEAGGEQWGEGVPITSSPDIVQAEELRQWIGKKNQFYRQRLRPLNKTYIFLFRRHEMGHLAYELDDLQRLAEENEEVIAKLRVPRPHSYSLEQSRGWKSPRDYPDHEVPKHIPPPNTDNELKEFTVADGLEANLFAEDPMIANPINLNWDTRGRAWVSTSTTYPHIKPGHIPNDRIVILEDTDNDGRADKHTVFAEGLLVPHSVMPVPGGAYVCSATEFLFLADADGDDVSESRRVVYSGFGNADVHHMIHGLRWAPWGDLHFTQSIYINSFVETPWGNRRLNGSGIWRFRPETGQLDPLAVGMVNPWGYALNSWGQGFGTDGAGGAGPHYVFPGAAFPTAVGVHRVLPGLVPGKPKNTGAEFVSGRHMPERLLGSLLGNDFRANRTVRYELKESGSGYTAEEVETVLESKHRSFRPVDIKMGPEGAIYVVDWYNAIIDHGEVDFHHPLRDKAHGRIWRLTAKGRPLVERPKIHGAPIPDLLNLLKAPEQYTRTQANRELATRPSQELAKQVLEWVAALDTRHHEYEQHRLEALWVLMAQRIEPPALVEDILRSPDHHARAAAVRAVSNWRSQAGGIDRLALLTRAVEDEHPRVRLEAVNGLRGLGTLDAVSAALRALDRDRDDHLNFAIELTVRALRDVWLPALESGMTVFDGNAARLDYALREVNDPRAVGRLLEIVQRGGLEGEQLANAARTVAALGTAEHLDALLAQPPALLPAIAEGARSNAAKASETGRLVELLDGDTALAAAAELCGRWGVSAAVEPLAKLLREKDVASAAVALARLGAIEQLKTINTPTSIAAWAAAQPAEALPAAIAKFSEPIVAAYLQHADGPAILAGGLADVKVPEALAVAATRLAHASGRDVGPLVAALNTAGNLKTVGLRLTPEDRRTLLADAAAKGDAARGRDIYQRKDLACATCHTIDNQGGQLGPDLSTVGTYMTPESLLESVLNPSTAIKQGFETVLVTTKDKDVVAGLLQRKTNDAHLIRDPSGKVVSVPNSDIAKLDTSPVSLMPPSLTAPLRRDELVDLMKYLTTLGKAPR